MISEEFKIKLLTCDVFERHGKISHLQDQPFELSRMVAIIHHHNKREPMHVFCLCVCVHVCLAMNTIFQSLTLGMV